ncbi:MAG TPA: sulfurtransferase [Steroidobacteraceae bacterium]|nr:sulfurtransferase [Steroidobacteraceae bacterium]
MRFTTVIDAASLAPLLHDPGVAVIDCRFDLARPAAGRAAYLAGHIPGARYMSLDEDLSAPVAPGTGRHPLPTPDAFAARLGRAGIGDRVQVIAYDQANGAFAARLWWMLRWLGSARVAVLDGGYAAWSAAGGAAQSGEVAAAAAVFVPRIDSSAWVSTAEVVLALRDPRRLLIDARAPERFSGAVEPLDKVAGHVPGARNHPFTLNLRPDGRFLARRELRRRWREFLGGAAPAAAIAMCGSGVTACHNLLALEMAGLAGAKLYAGSFSEWIEDRERPVATGGAH